MAAFLSEHQVSLAGHDVLAACSGGADSVAMVELLAALPRGSRPRRLLIATVAHGLRDTAADRDAVAQVASRHGLELRVIEASDGDCPPAHDQGALREWRYQRLAQTATELGLSVIVTAHHADDQLESMLIGMIGSGGARAIAGIPVARELSSDLTLVRPLLAFRHEDLVTICRDSELAWVEDPANAATDEYRRAAIRHNVVPALLAAEPNAGALLERTRAAIASTAAVTSELAGWVASSAATAGAGEPAVDLRLIPEHAGARREVLACWLRQLGLGRTISARLVESVAGLGDSRSTVGSVAVRGGSIVRTRYHLHYEPTGKGVQHGSH